VRFQGQFTASPHIHLQRGVTKIRHKTDKKNSKFEIRNSKQIQNSKKKCPKHHYLLLFRYCYLQNYNLLFWLHF
jgi:hypothetical protein